MSSDIIELISSEGSAAVDQIIEDSGRLHTVVNGSGVESATTEDGSLIPSVRKALLDNLYFKTPVLPWNPGGSVTVFNQLYSYTDPNGVTEWWYSPPATASNPSVMQASPVNDAKFRLFLNGSNITYIYAPLASPNFTGNPRVPTPAAEDQSSSIANTQWVSDRIEDLKEQIDGSLTGNFENITISGTATVDTLHVTGESKFDGPIDASDTTLSLNKLRMVGEDAEIYFEESGTPPSGITQSTDIKPFSLSTGELSSQKAETDSLVVSGLQDATTVSTDLQGNAQADYVHITGNSNNDPTRPQLVVDGIAKFGTIQADNIQANVDGLDIRPNSVVTDEGVTVGTDLAVGGNTSLAATTTVQDLVINGSVTGLELDVTGQDISPRSVTTTADISVGTNLSVAGEADVGSIVAETLTVSGDSSLASVQADNIVAEDLSVTGTISLQTITARRIDLFATTLQDTQLPASVTLPTTSNIVNLVIDKDIAIQNIAVSGSTAFTMNVYLRQDATGGHAVTLGTGYTILNPDTAIPTTANSVTILQLSYSGFSGDNVDVAIFVRP